MKFWNDKRVLLTGHTGFKGSWLALWLKRLGARVTGYALDPPTDPSLYQLAHVSDDIRDIRGDVRDLELLCKTLRSLQPEIVIHMAAQPIVRQAYANPVETYATNVMGTVHLLEAVRQTPSVRVGLIVTSDKCYANRGWAWGYREDDALGGQDPYSNSKGCAELVTAAYRSSYFAGTTTAVASVRAGNVIGGGDWAKDRLIPDIVRAFSAAEPVSLRNPAAVRPWQHVLEPLSGYLLLAERLWSHPELADGWNFGPRDEDAQPVSVVVEQLAALWGAGAVWTQDSAAHPPEHHTLKLDCSQARSRLGWTPRLTLATALQWTVEWYQGQVQGRDVREQTLAQIAAFEQLGGCRAEVASGHPLNRLAIAT